MKYYLLLFALFTSISVFAQEKGVSPITSPPPTGGGRGEAYAVVVGISDYQDEGIPDLRFADRDAEAFANFLRSPAGGSLDGDHLKLLTNKHATTAQFDAALGWLIDETKEGDQAIIYFSGHGDVETKTRSQQGFLLCWDSPPQAYVSGAYPIFFLKEVVSTLSLENKAKVIIITDACRSGKLAGNTFGGSQLTSQNLAQQFANEIKVLSCQPNEYSIEGEQWGGGRGAFSYHLVDGLYGMADSNNDSSVNLMEIGRYLDDHVTMEVAPQSQVPMTVGNRTEKLAQVVPEILALVRKDKANQLPTFSPTDSRGIEENVLATVDTTIQEFYKLFKKALEDKVFLQPANSATPAYECADAYYERLIAEPKMERLHNTIRRNYAAALQDDAQQVMNKWMKADVSELALSKKTQSEKYLPYPQYLERAAQLLGSQHYMFPVLMARMHFFKGYLMALSDHNPNKELGEKALSNFRASLQWQPNSPVAYWQMSLVHGYNFRDLDSADYYVEKAMALSPSWVMPYCDVSTMVFFTTYNAEIIKSYIEKATQIDSNSIIILGYWGAYYTLTEQFGEAEKVFIKETQIDPNNLGGWNNLGWLYNMMGRLPEAEAALKEAIAIDSTQMMPWFLLGWCYAAANRFKESETAYKKSISLDSTVPESYCNLAGVYMALELYEEAEQALNKALQLDSAAAYIHSTWGRLYRKTNRYTEAELTYKKAFQLDSTFIVAYYNIACLRSIQNQVDTAFEILEETLKKGYNNYGWMNEDPDFIPLRERKEQWAVLMEKYFPGFIAYNLACEQSLQNQIDSAFISLELSLKNGYKNYNWMQEDIDLAPLREQKEQWEELMNKYLPHQAKD